MSDELVLAQMEIERLRGELTHSETHREQNREIAFEYLANITKLRDHIVRIENARIEMLKNGDKIISELANRLVAVEAERDVAVKDAERYRYLRGMNSMMCCVQCGYDGLELQVGEKLDAAIDAARNNNE